MPRSLDAIPGHERGVELLGILRPYVRHCGDSFRPPWRIPARKLLDYLLVYIADGEGRFELAEEAWAMAAGDLFWVPPDRVHDMTGHPPGMRCVYVHFDLLYDPHRSHWDFSVPAGTTDLSPFGHLMHPPVAHPLLDDLPGRLRIPTGRRAGQRMIDLTAEAGRAQPFSQLLLAGMLLEIFGEILRGRGGLPAESGEHIPQIEAAAKMLRDHLAEDVSLEEVARGIDLSPSHFRHLFARHFGCPPRTYLRRARIRKAKEWMVGSSLNFSEIARAVGFANVHAFSRAFKSEEGLTPTDYRRSDTPRVYVEGRPPPYSR